MLFLCFFIIYSSKPMHSDKSYAKSSEFWTGCRISAIVQNRIDSFNFLSPDHVLWTKPDPQVPKTWSAVNRVGLQVKNKSVPLHVLFIFHCTRQQPITTRTTLNLCYDSLSMGSLRTKNIKQQQPYFLERIIFAMLQPDNRKKEIPHQHFILFEPIFF